MSAVRGLAAVTVVVLAVTGIATGASASAQNRQSWDLSWSCASSFTAPAYPLHSGKAPVIPVEKACFGPDMPKAFRGGTPVQVRIQMTNPDTGKASTGPVIMAFDDLSDTHLFVTYGPRSLWLYDHLTTSGSSALRVSESTGKVVQSVKIPGINDTFGYANTGGLWIAEGDQGVQTTRITVYHIAPDSNDVQILKNQSLSSFASKAHDGYPG